MQIKRPYEYRGLESLGKWYFPYSQESHYFLLFFHSQSKPKLLFLKKTKNGSRIENIWHHNWVLSALVHGWGQKANTDTHTVHLLRWCHRVVTRRFIILIFISKDSVAFFQSFFFFFFLLLLLFWVTTTNHIYSLLKGKSLIIGQ